MNLAHTHEIGKHPSLSRDNSILEKLSLKEVVKINSQGHVFSQAFRKLLWLSSNEACAYCGDQIGAYEEMRVDHFLPKNTQNCEDINNYVSCCKTCNSIKGNKSVEEFRFRLAVYKSELRGIVSPGQAKQLVDLGVSLPISLPEFYFEKIAERESL